MKRIVMLTCLLVLTTTLAFPQTGVVCLFSDPQGTNCKITDSAPGLLSVYVVHTQTVGVSAVEFGAPKPSCMLGAVFLSDTYAFPIVIGDSQHGVSVGYNACRSGSIHVLTINYFGRGMTSPDCPYPVLPHPIFGRIVAVTCDFDELEAQGGTAYVNSDLPCVCSYSLTPILGVTPTNLAFGHADVTRTFAISNVGGGALTWNVSESIPWLTTSLSSGTGNATITVTVDRSGLSDGSYSGSIEVTSNGGNRTVTVTMDVNTTPILAVNPMSLDFSETEIYKAFAISNVGGGTLTWNVSESIPWLTAVPTGGTGNAYITVAVDRTGLPVGSHSGLIEVTSNGGNETVTVTMDVSSTVLGVSPTSLSFGVGVTDRFLNVFNAGVGSLHWSIDCDQFWLSVCPSSGTNDAQVTVHVDRAGTTESTYNGNLFVTSNGGNITVPVEMTGGVELYVNPPLLVFSGSVTTNTFTVSNSGGEGTLTWSLTADEPWIDIVSPHSGTGSAMVVVNVDPGSVPCCGVRVGHATVNSNGGVRTVEVRFNSPGPAAGGSMGVYAEPTGTDCNIPDVSSGPFTVYVVHTGTPTAAASEFSAPKPACMTGATWLSDTFVYPVSIGNTQTGVSVGYGACRAAPIHVLTINYYATGSSEVCCMYPVLPHPLSASGKIEVVDCAENLVFATGTISTVNGNPGCACGSVRVEHTTWGRVKALYAPESTGAIRR